MGYLTGQSIILKVITVIAGSLFFPSKKVQLWFNTIIVFVFLCFFFSLYKDETFPTVAATPADGLVRLAIARDAV